MNIRNIPVFAKIILAGVMLLVLFIIFRFFFGGTDAINPKTNKLDTNPDAGIEYAILFNQGELYGQIDSDDGNLRLIELDMALFARTTRLEFKNKNTLIGFTFDKGFKSNGNTNTYTGFYYGVPDKIKLDVTAYEAGYITLSITNTADETNIDSSLNLNGPKNKLITSLPVESDKYSIRYFKSRDSVVAAFYKGYSEKDVDAVIAVLQDAYGESYLDSDIVFNINAVGNFSLEEVRAYSKTDDNRL